MPECDVANPGFLQLDSVHDTTPSRPRLGKDSLTIQNNLCLELAWALDLISSASERCFSLSSYISKLDLQGKARYLESLMSIAT